MLLFRSSEEPAADLLGDIGAVEVRGTIVELEIGQAACVQPYRRGVPHILHAGFDIDLVATRVAEAADEAGLARQLPACPAPPPARPPSLTVAGHPPRPPAPPPRPPAPPPP